MSLAPPVLRAAEPTFDEGLAFARYLDEAAEGFFRFLLGSRAAEVVAGAYLQPDNDYSFQNVTFAEQGRAIVGMTSGFTAEQRRSFSNRPLTPAAGLPAFRLAALRLLCAPLFRVLETLAEGDFYLQAIAVDPKARGAGVGSGLMDFMEERARAGGSTRLALDVSAKNERARRLYERRGMSVESRWPRPPFLPTLFVRMAKPL